MADSITATPPLPAANHQPIFKKLKSAWESSDYSDLKITCDGLEWNVHRVIVCPSSPFFASCCKNFKEASSGVIDLPDDNKHVVDAMLTWMYMADYNDDDPATNIPAPLFDVQVHTIGDKYGIPDLCQLAEAKFAVLAATEWESSGFALAVREMYKTAPDSKVALQECAVKNVVKHAKVLFKEKKSKFADISRTVAPFAHQVSTELMAKKQQREGEIRYQCPGCSKTFVCEKFGTNSHNGGYYNGHYVKCLSCLDQFAISQFKIIEED
ncbi:hypothetical protein CBER1_11333 [Cercospora berteroae]|uniref:BTB domain-containing protein n=1 Tax=Cercospora berteroae TaxID=357750 RepID=A0A2S6BZW0_9PEZI|nr:hypothetical protein CBER1_11333 [Cercospora berteroae]